MENLPELSFYQFQQDFQLLEGVLTHLSTLFLRLKNHVRLDNPLLSDIKKNDPETFEMTRKILSNMPAFEREDLSEDEIAYVALHFMAAKERVKDKEKFNILVICATGYGSAQMLKNRIDNELGNLVQIVDVVGYYDLNDERLQGIDCIISSIDLSNLVFHVPVFTVSIFLNSEEVREIKGRLKEMSPMKVARKGLSQERQKANLSQLFDEYFSEEAFIVADCLDKEELLEVLLLEMADGEEEDFVLKMKDCIEQRERVSSIVFSPQIAVPHPIKPLARQHKIGLAMLTSGMAWGEAEQIHFVFLPSPSIYENEGMADLTGKIIELLEQKDKQERLLACKSLSDFKEEFLK